MMRKAKNDRPRSSYRKIAKWGCIFLLVLGCLGLLVIRQIILDFSEEGGWMMGPGLSDYCMSVSHVHIVKLAGRVMDEQGQPITQAQVELGSEEPHSCDSSITLHHITTNESGTFSFDGTFEYEDQFFISASAEDCQPSTIYDNRRSANDITIILKCTTTP